MPSQAERLYQGHCIMLKNDKNDKNNVFKQQNPGFESYSIKIIAGCPSVCLLFLYRRQTAPMPRWRWKGSLLGCRTCFKGCRSRGRNSRSRWAPSDDPPLELSWPLPLVSDAGRLLLALVSGHILDVPHKRSSCLLCCFPWISGPYPIWKKCLISVGATVFGGICVKNNIFSIIIIMYIYHALVNTLNTHMIHINLNLIFYTHVEHSPTKTVHIKYYLTHTHTHTHTHTPNKNNN